MEVIGSVTAGAWSPFLETGIAIVQLNYDLESLSEGKLRTNSGIHDVKICDLPFHDKEKYSYRLDMFSDKELILLQKRLLTYLWI